MCKYRDVFGRPGKGVHALRIPVVDLAAVDVVGALLVAWAIARTWRVSMLLTCAAVFVCGVVVHAVFCVDTRVNRWLADLNFRG